MVLTQMGDRTSIYGTDVQAQCEAFEVAFQRMDMDGTEQVSIDGKAVSIRPRIWWDPT